MLTVTKKPRSRTWPRQFGAGLRRKESHCTATELTSRTMFGRSIPPFSQLLFASILGIASGVYIFQPWYFIQFKQEHLKKLELNKRGHVPSKSDEPPEKADQTQKVNGPNDET